MFALIRRALVVAAKITAGISFVAFIIMAAALNIALWGRIPADDHNNFMLAIMVSLLSTLAVYCFGQPTVKFVRA